MEGYTIGRTPGSVEVGSARVCAHGEPLGWSCVGCGMDRDGYVNSAPAGPAADTVYRAVCDHCGSRVWLPSAQVDAETRARIDADEEARRFAGRGAWAKS